MVLEDHVQKGKKLLPTMLADQHPVAQGQWIMDRLPNHFWISWCIKNRGLKHALIQLKSMSSEITSLLKERRKDDTCFRAHLLHDHWGLSDADKRFLKAKTRESPWRLEVEPTLRDICSLFEDFPLRYLVSGRVAKMSGHDKRVEDLKQLLVECSHRHDRLALHTQAVIFVVEVECGAISFAEGLDLPDVNAILDYPNTEESKHAAGFLVSFCGCITAMLTVTGVDNDTWPRNFWNTCYQLERDDHYVE